MSCIGTYRHASQLACMYMIYIPTGIIAMLLLSSYACSSHCRATLTFDYPSQRCPAHRVPVEGIVDNCVVPVESLREEDVRHFHAKSTQ